MTKPQREFRQFLKHAGKQFEKHVGNGPMYLSSVKSMGADDVPFPSNKMFRSEPVLSSRARQIIWEAVMLKGMPLKAVSAQYQVDVRRVAAVVRLMEIEKRMEKEVCSFYSPVNRPGRRRVIFFFFFYHDDSTKKYSISLEDKTVVKNFC